MSVKPQARKGKTSPGARVRVGRTTRDAAINIRAREELRDLIDRAASISGKSRSEFMLESARVQAENVLLDQSLFGLDAQAYQAFVDILDNPPPPNDKLRRLLTSKAPWE